MNANWYLLNRGGQLAIGIENSFVRALHVFNTFFLGCQTSQITTFECQSVQINCPYTKRQRQRQRQHNLTDCLCVWLIRIPYIFDFIHGYGLCLCLQNNLYYFSVCYNTIFDRNEITLKHHIRRTLLSFAARKTQCRHSLNIYLQDTINRETCLLW